MKKKHMVVVAIIIIIFFIISFLLPFVNILAAPTKNDLQNKLSDLNKQKKEAEKKLSEVREEKQDALFEKKKIDNQITGISQDINEINVEIGGFENAIGVSETELSNAEKLAQEQSEMLKKRLRAMYEDGVSSYLEIILSAKTFTDFIARYEMISDIVEYDKNLLNKMKEAAQNIEIKKNELENQKNNKENSKNKLVSKKSELDIKQNEQKSFIEKLSKDELAYKKALEQAERAEREVLNTIANLQKKQGNVKYVGGKLQWPTEGYYNITSDFGMRLHPLLKIKKMHTGIDVAAPTGATVVSAADGTVLTSQYNSAYGNYITIDHGGLITLYAHNSKLLVGVGDKVKKGQKISQVGSTGWSTGPHLHFEVIEGGVQKNPMSYFN